MDCIYIALFRPVATQCFVQSLPYIHPFIHRGRCPSWNGTASWLKASPARGHQPGIEPATFRLLNNLLPLLSHCHPKEGIGCHKFPLKRAVIGCIRSNGPDPRRSSEYERERGERGVGRQFRFRVKVKKMFLTSAPRCTLFCFSSSPVELSTLQSLTERTQQGPTDVFFVRTLLEKEENPLR